MKRKYNYTKLQEEQIMNDAVGIVRWTLAMVTIFLAIIIAGLTVAFPIYGLFILAFITAAFVSHKFILAAIVVQHHKKVLSQDDNIESEEEQS